MNGQLLGIHHVTAIVGDPQRNIDFYAGLLGLRLVKLTVNFDDPTTYHLYFGDEQGRPGTIITFFPWPGAPRGRRGSGQVSGIGFAIPENALDFWMERLRAHNISASGPSQRFDEQVLAFADPDGLPLELVARRDAADQQGWPDGPVPAAHAIRGFSGITLAVEGQERTAALLSGMLGFSQIAESGPRLRFGLGTGGSGSLVDLLNGDHSRGSIAVGSVHHIAWRIADDPGQAALRQELVAAGLGVSPVMDRKYFHSIYFREPGGVLFEVATDAPGFAIDEPADQLGTHLVLPPWLEGERARLERALPPLVLPGVGQMS